MTELASPTHDQLLAFLVTISQILWWPYPAHICSYLNYPIYDGKG